ncbi:Hsp20/alpha crystallin family protein [Bacillus carboniphilus]|uniref:Hsp20/alpha crystallin family protein n=1 Tax=Bacillus carboniphilus TaxID=86663 RepID=A0ABY9JVF0_9BACI|nr:Hsp20/alpha crystallin family protein [Bacillus carboniphilus]WLR43360.1 Hsp20/alpha crystallin family protein [Bacillus carboniphilus]
MDNEKLMQWLNLAKNVYGSEFWETLFDEDFNRSMLKNSYVNHSIHQGIQSFPSYDVIEEDSYVNILIDLPGFDRNDIDLTAHKTMLVVKGSRKSNDLQFYHKGRFYGDFEKNIRLPKPLKENHMQAKMINGVLYIAYAVEEEQGETIPID